MTTTTDLLPRCTVPCPSWCAWPAGHPYESDDSDGNGIRYHELEIGKTSRAVVTITAEAIEAGDSERVDLAVVQVLGLSGSDDAVGDLSVLGARELAGLLVEAADRLAGILAHEVDVHAAVAAAETEARALHDAGRCSESEWSCSFCEQETAR